MDEGSRIFFLNSRLSQPAYYIGELCGPWIAKGLPSFEGEHRVTGGLDNVPTLLLYIECGLQNLAYV